MAAKIDQKAYLQKYLGGPSADKKKKKRKKIPKGNGITIIDDDLDVSKLRELDGDELDFLDQGEDAPQIAGIIDERPEDVRKLETFSSSSKWRVINQDDGFNSKLQIEEIKRDTKQVEKENQLIFGKMYSDSEDEAKNDSDPSPPRKQSQPPKAKKVQNNSDSDLSPPRKNEISSKNNHDSDVSPRRKHDSRPKERKKPSRWGTEPTNKRHSKSPQHKTKYDSGESPRRKKRKHTDKSPRRSGDSRKRNKTPDSDVSPPRKRKQSPCVNKKHTKTDRKRRKSTDSDESPPRKHLGRKKSQSPPESGRRRKHSSDSDFSPQRKEQLPYLRSSNSPPPTNKKMAKTLDGKLAGLQDAKQLREENSAFRRREEDAFNKMADEVSGRNAQVMSRKNKRETSEERNKQKEKAERQKELDEKYKRWTKGVKQAEAQEERMKDFIHEASKPLARHKDDKDLESSLKDIEREGDPMLKYIRERKRERGELPPEKPTYKGNFPPNRFNIRPGYRWDGVDRSNGYEKKYFENQSKRRAQELDAYKWSTEDL